jgi:protein FRA10AC1
VLRTLELPFGYVEQGEVKSALVKVVLCGKCVKKILWKREQLKKGATAEEGPDTTRASNSGGEVSKRNSSCREVSRSPSGQESRRRRSRSRSPDRMRTRDRPKE